MLLGRNHHQTKFTYLIYHCSLVYIQGKNKTNIDDDLTS